MKRNKRLATFVGQSFLNFTPIPTFKAVTFTSAHEKHFVRKSNYLAKKIIKPRVYFQEIDCN